MKKLLFSTPTFGYQFDRLTDAVWPAPLPLVEL